MGRLDCRGPRWSSRAPVLESVSGLENRPHFFYQVSRAPSVRLRHFVDLASQVHARLVAPLRGARCANAGNPFPVWFCATRQSRMALGVIRPYPAALVPNGFQRSRKPAPDMGLRLPLLQPLCHQCFPRQLPQICAGVAFPRCAQRMFCVADDLESVGQLAPDLIPRGFAMHTRNPRPAHDPVCWHLTRRFC
jgi:hypothetical protein